MDREGNHSQDLFNTRQRANTTPIQETTFQFILRSIQHLQGPGLKFVILKIPQFAEIKTSVPLMTGIFVMLMWQTGRRSFCLNKVKIYLRLMRKPQCKGTS